MRRRRVRWTNNQRPFAPHLRDKTNLGCLCRYQSLDNDWPTKRVGGGGGADVSQDWNMAIKSQIYLILICSCTFQRDFYCVRCTVNSLGNCALGEGGAEDVKFIMREGREG